MMVLAQNDLHKSVTAVNYATAEHCVEQDDPLQGLAVTVNIYTILNGKDVPVYVYITSFNRLDNSAQL